MRKPSWLFWSLFLLARAADEAKPKPTPAPPKTVTFLRFTMAASYFSESSSLNTYFRHQERLWDVGTELAKFFSKEACRANLEDTNTRKQIRYSVPRVSTPEYFQVRGILDAVTLAFTYSDGSLQANLADDRVTWKNVAGDALDMFSRQIQAELNFLLDAVMDDPSIFVRWTEFSPWTDRIKPLKSLVSAMATASSACSVHAELAAPLAGLAAHGKTVEVMSKLAKNLNAQIKKYPERFGLTSKPEGGDEKDLELGAVGKERYVADPGMVKNINQRIEQLNKKLADGGGGGDKGPGKAVVVDNRLEKTLKLALESSAIVSLTIKADESLQFPSLAQINDFHQVSPYWKNRQEDVKKALLHHLTKEFGYFFPRLPEQLQISATNGPINLKLTLSAELECGDESIRALAHRYTIKGVDGPAFPFRILTGPDDALTNQAGAKLLGAFVSDLANSRGLKALKWSGANNLGCTLAEGVGRCFNQGAETQGLCLNYGVGLDMSEDVYKAWPICLGIYPPDTSIFGKDMPDKALKEIQQAEAQLADFMAGLPAKLQAARAEKQREAEAAAAEQYQMQLEAWKAAVKPPEPQPPQARMSMSRRRGASLPSNSGIGGSEDGSDVEPPPVNSVPRFQSIKPLQGNEPGGMSFGSDDGPLSVRRIRRRANAAAKVAAAPIFLQTGEEQEKEEDNVVVALLQREMSEIASYRQRVPKNKQQKRKPARKEKAAKKKKKSVAFEAPPRNVPAKLSIPQHRSVKQQPAMPTPPQPVAVPKLEIDEVPSLHNEKMRLEQRIRDVKQDATKSVWVGCYCSTINAKQGTPLKWTLPVEVPPNVAEQCPVTMVNPLFPVKLSGLAVGEHYDAGSGSLVRDVRSVENLSRIRKRFEA